jgi:hypothetical protein
MAVPTPIYDSEMQIKGQEKFSQIETQYQLKQHLKIKTHVKIYTFIR